VNASIQASTIESALPIPRKFKPGQFVRITADDETNGEVGIIFEDDGDDEYSDPYWVALYDANDSEKCYSANELIPWVPKVGERVIEANDCGHIGDVGVVLANDGTTSHIQWKTLKDAPYWPNIRLEPAEPNDDVD
jgi:hypothetical protein